MEITKDKYEAYESVRESGVTNMFDVKVVSELSELTKDEIFYIMQNYNELSKKYG